MSGEALRQEIRKAAETKAKQILVDAKQSADKIVAEAEAEAGKVLEDRVHDLEESLKQVEKSEAAKARMESSGRILGIHSRYTEEAFREAESRVKSLPTTDPVLYRSVLTNFITEAIEEVGSVRVVAVVRPSDRALAEEILKNLAGARGAGGRGAQCSVSSESLDVTGGVVFHTDDKRFYFVNTFESRFLKAREEVRAKVMDALLRDG
jgi:V/A-type H+-transporting ATPase subunit E